MNTTSRAILRTVLSTDPTLSSPERGTVQRLLDGEIEAEPEGSGGSEECLLVTQKKAAECLSVSRATVWRMTKDCVLHPVEIIPGTWRYPFREIIALAREGLGRAAETATPREKSAA